MEKGQGRQLLLLASRTILIAVAFKQLLPHLFPHGPAVAIQHRPQCTAIDPDNKSMTFAGGKLTKIYERNNKEQQPLLTKPETILFDNRGVMYIMNENAKLISLTDFEQQEDRSDDNKSIITAKATEVADLGMGRPLGGKFDMKGCLYFADVLLGLARICNLPTTTSSSNNKPLVELVASRVKLPNGTWSPILYADDVDIGPKTGHVYFSDATDVTTDRDIHTGMLDFVYSSKIEGIRGKRTGRILRYKPETGEVDILATGAAFANGVAVDRDETYVLYTSTYEADVMKYHLTGEHKGTADRLHLSFPGFLDGTDCSFSREVLCYVAIPTPVPGLAAAIFSMPSWISLFLRSFLMMTPRTLSPPPEHYGGAAEIHPGDGDNGARIVRVFQDPDGVDMDFITGVTVHERKLYLGSLHNNFVGVLSLD